MDKQHILDEIKRIARQDSDSPPGQGKFVKLTSIRESDWKGKTWNNWNNWGDVLEETGYSRNPWQQSYTEEFLI